MRRFCWRWRKPRLCAGTTRACDDRIDRVHIRPLAEKESARRVGSAGSMQPDLKTAEARGRKVVADGLCPARQSGPKTQLPKFPWGKHGAGDPD